MPKVRVTPIIGLPQFNGWSQVVESPPHSSVKTVLSIAIEGNHAGNVGRDIANYFSSQVVQTLEEFHILLEEIIDQAAENEVRILYSAGFFSGKKCAYATCNGAVLLRRADKIGTILSSGNQLKLITGEVGIHDVVVFSTLPSARFFSEIEIKFTQGYDVDTIVTSVVPGLHAEQNSSLSSLAFVTFSESTDAVSHVFASNLAGQETESNEEIAPTYYQPDLHHQPDISAATHNISTEFFEDSSQGVSGANAPNGANSIDDGGDSNKMMDQVADKDLSKDPVDAGVVDTLRASLDDSSAQSSAQKQGISSMFFALLSRLGSFFSVLVAGVQSLGQVALPKMQAGFGRTQDLIKTMTAKIVKKKPDDFSRQSTASQPGTSFRSLLPSADVYLETSNSKRVRNIRILVLTVSLLLIVGVGFFVIFSRRTAEAQAVESLLAPYLERVALAEELAKTDPVSARREVQDILRAIEDLQAQYNETSLSYTLISAQREKIHELHTAISGLDTLQELPIFYDLRLVSSDFIASKVLMHESVLYFFDTEQKTAIRLDSTTKQAAKRDIPVGTFVDTALLDGHPLILTTEGIGRARFLEDGLDYEEAIAVGDSNRSAALVGTYSPYVYVVNPEKRNIYRYTQSGERFSDPIGWIQEIARGLDFSTISSIAIDGDVWLGTKNGSLYKFTRGRVQDFEIRGLQKPFNSNVLVHTAGSLERLYILEAQDSRIVILQKNGDFIKEIRNTSLGSVTDIVVNDAGTVLYAISGSVVFMLDI